MDHRAAIARPAEAGGLLREIEDHGGHPLTALRSALLPYLFDRPGELRWAEWRAFVPTPARARALAIIGEIEPDASFSGFLFPSLRALDRPMSDNTINAALRRLGFLKDQMTGHGFRAMAATLLNEMGIWNPDASSGNWHMPTATRSAGLTRGASIGTSASG